MTHLNDYDHFDPAILPATVARYIGGHAEPDLRTEIGDLFAHDARVVDEGIEYSGVEEIRGWLNKSASEYTFTTTPLGQRRAGTSRWVVLVRLEGTFPGGAVDLRYQIATKDDLISDLVIGL